MIGQDEIARLRDLALRASPGPWTVDDEERRPDGTRRYFPSLRFRPSRCAGWDGDGTVVINNSASQTAVEIDATAEFIAAANPLVVLALLEEIERLDRKADELYGRWLDGVRR